MTDKEKLLTVLLDLGTVNEEDNRFPEEDESPLFPKGTRSTVQVMQSYFCFDKDQKFIAVVGGEDGSCQFRVR
jgi:hypothetical protein